MINDPIYNHLRELSWRRKLTASEEVELRAWLAAHPEAQSDWEAETGLNDTLGLLPEAVVSSNFTARVLAAVQRQEAAELRRSRGLRMAWWRRLASKAALAAIVLAAGIFSYHHFQAARIRQEAQMQAEARTRLEARMQAEARMRAEVVNGLVTISNVPSLPDPEALEDFDAIWLMAPLYADDKLLTLLK